MRIASAVASRAQTRQSPREQCGAVGQEKSVAHTSAPSTPVSIPASIDLLRRETYPWSDSPPCDPPTLPETLCLSGASETLSRTERQAQQKRPPSGLRNEASVWRAPSAAPGQAPWRPQGETKHTLGAQLALKVEEFKTQEATQRDGKHGLTRQGLRTGDRVLVASPAWIEHECVGSMQ